MATVHLLDYVAGNVRSLANAIEKLGFSVAWITKPEDILNAEVGGRNQFPIHLQCLCAKLTLHSSLAEAHSPWRWTFRPLSLSAIA